MDVDDKSRQYKTGSSKYRKFIKIMGDYSSIAGDRIMLEQKRHNFFFQLHGW